MGSVTFTARYATSVTVTATFELRITFSESYDAAANKTTLRITRLELKKEGNETLYGSLPFFGTVKVNGSTLLTMNGGSSVRVNLNGGGFNAVAIPSSASVVITHDTDGSKSVSFSLSGGIAYGERQYCGALYTVNNSRVPFGVPAGSREVALTAHPRASSISSISAAVDTLGAFSLSVERNSPDFFHKAGFSVGGTLLHTSEPFAASLSYTVPRSWFSAYPSAVSLSAAVSVQTYSDASCTTPVGSPVTESFTVNADAGMKPSVSAGWASLAPYNSGAVANITGYVKGFSRAEALFDPSKIDLSAAVGASIAAYTVSCQGESVSASPYRTGVLASTETSVVCTVTDTRGRSASETIPLSVMDYAAPTLTGIEIFRCGALGAADEDGGFCSVRAVLGYAGLNGQNSCALYAAYKAAGGSYGTETALTSGTAAVIGPLSADLSYTVRLRAADALGSSTLYYATVPTRKWAMKFRPDGRGVAFGKAAETDGMFEVSPDWTVKLGDSYPVVSDSSVGTRVTALYVENGVLYLTAGGTTYHAALSS